MNLFYVIDSMNAEDVAKLEELLAQPRNFFLGEQVLRLDGKIKPMRASNGILFSARLSVCTPLTRTGLAYILEGLGSRS